MARYPTFDEYARTGKYAEGIKRCDELLKRSPKDVTLLITKLQLLGASQQDIGSALDQILEIQPPISDLHELVSIEAAVVDSNKNTHPRPISAGLVVSKLWENAFKASTIHTYKISLIEFRFDHAVTDNRLQDVQQTLIMLKAYQPKNRTVYMAHAAYTQLLSTSKDDLQSKLALGLARKAVSGKFDDDRQLDCRVPGQIFAIQGAEQDLKGLANRPFRESQHVYKALQLSGPITVNAMESQQQTIDPTKVSSREWLSAEVDSLKKDFQDLIQHNANHDIMKEFVANATRLFNTTTESLDLGGRNRGAADVIFLAISGLVKLFADNADDVYLLQAAYLGERLLKYNERIHEARLILVYLYMRLNLGSLAMRLFDSLSIKEIQHDTVGHILFSQLSTVHPFRTNLSSKEVYDPWEKTNKALGVYPRHEDKLSEIESSVLNHSQTGMIFDLQHLRETLRDSLARRLFLLEHRQIARITGKAYGKNASKVGPRVVGNWIKTKDNRDFNAAFDYGFNLERTLYSWDDSSLLHNLAIDTAWSIATNQTPLILDTQNLVLPTPSSVSPFPRQLVGQVAQTIISLCTATTSDQAQTLLKQLKRLPLESLIHTTDTLAEHLSDHFVYIDILLTTQQACRHIKASAVHVPPEIAQAQDFCTKGAKILHAHAVEQGVAVNADHIRAKMQKSKPPGDLFEEQSLESFIQSVVASAKEGWEGVSMVAVS